MSNARTLASLIDDTNTRIKIPSGYGLDFVNYGEEESPDNTATDVTRNKLDDYEEGTFDLIGKDTGDSTQFTANNQVYQKIGNRCFVEIIFTHSSGSSASKIYGLPFTASGQSWSPNSQFLDRHTYVNDGASYITWATSSTVGHTIRMKFSYRTV